jgi:hypothetical protein
MMSLARLAWTCLPLACLAAGGAVAAEDGAGRDKGVVIEERRPEPKPESAAPERAEKDAKAAPEKKPEAKPAATDKAVEFDQAPASQVLTFISQGAGVNIVVDPACAEKLMTPVSFRGRGMTYRQLLNWVVRLSGTAWTLADGAVFVTTRDKVPPEEDVAEAARKYIAEHPELVPEPAKFDPPPDIGSLRTK